MPDRFTGHGDNVSPALEWDDAPEGVRAFALIMDDAESPAGTWSHWVLYGIPGEARTLPEAVPSGGRVERIGVQGTNDFGAQGYGGPSPPFERTHRYVFRLYALGDAVTLPPGLRRADLFAALHGRVIAHAELSVRYGAA
jgi:Raf kinase inhibitor-like YbhB/YbcL family protein